MLTVKEKRLLNYDLNTLKDFIIQFLKQSTGDE